MDTDTETGAEAGGESYFAQIEAEQTAAEAAVPVEAAPDAPQVEAEPEAAAEAAPEPDKPPLEPLTPEEYQRRHDNLNAALKQERAEKREMKALLAQLQSRVEEIHTTQPQQFQQFTLDQQISDYQTIDWRAWADADPVAANNAALHYQQLMDQRDGLRTQSEQAQQARQQQEQQAALTQFAESLNASEDEFRRVKPDYENATAFLRDTLRKEAEWQGFFGEQAEQYVQNTLVQTGLRVHAAGKDLAEFAYSMAQQRGYTPPAPDLASVRAGADAAKSISTLGPRSSNTDGGSFEEVMGGLNGASARSFWEKAKASQYR